MRLQDDVDQFNWDQEAKQMLAELAEKEFEMALIAAVKAAEEVAAVLAAAVTTVAAPAVVVDVDNFQFQYEDDEVVFPDETISCDHSLGCCVDY